MGTSILAGGGLSNLCLCLCVCACMCAWEGANPQLCWCHWPCGESSHKLIVHASWLINSWFICLSIKNMCPWHQRPESAPQGAPITPVPRGWAKVCQGGRCIILSCGFPCARACVFLSRLSRVHRAGDGGTNEFDNLPSTLIYQPVYPSYVFSWFLLSLVCHAFTFMSRVCVQLKWVWNRRWHKRGFILERYDGTIALIYSIRDRTQRARLIALVSL